MDVLSIHGGRPLRRYSWPGPVSHKTLPLPIMAASILADEPVVLAGVPDVADVNTLALMLGHVGVEVKRRPSGVVHINTVDAAPVTAGAELVQQIHTACLLGPLLAKRGRAVIALPGGNLAPAR